jgi:hypothetical protein
MFHVSRVDLGFTATLVPQIPFTLCKKECKKTPRVCFSPTVELCLIAIGAFGEMPGVKILANFLELSSSFTCPTVYQYNGTLVKPDDSLKGSDFDLTQEHWALTEVEVRRVGYLDYVTMRKNNKIEIVDSSKGAINEAW